MMGKETHVPPGLNSIAIPTFKNQTFEPGIEIPFTQTLLNEFIQDRRVKVVSRAEADCILEGAITYFTTAGSAYNTLGFASEYAVNVKINLSLKDRTGKVLWEEKNWGLSAWFLTQSVSVSNEAAKQAAIQKAAGDFAEAVRNRFFYNF
jgi:hypothetical protein